MASAERGRKRPGRVKRLVERVVLSVLLSVAAYVVERRLRRALRLDSGRKRSRRTVRLG